MAANALKSSRVWFITGTSSGLGRALTLAVLAKGERVAGSARNTATLKEIEAQYPAARFLPLKLDVTDVAQIDAAFASIKAHFGRLDVIVNNAGYGLAGEIEATPDDEARRQIETLFWGPVNICKRAIPFFRDVNPAGAGGRILNISSCGGYAANTVLAFYSAGKFALEGFTQALNREMPPEWNIKAVIVQPGGFGTNWSTSGMVRLPPHPAYGPDAPSNQFRKMAEHAPGVGDVPRGVQAMIRIADLPNPPQRVQLGTDSWCIVRNQAEKTLKDSEEWEELSHSTNNDQYGPGQIDFLKAALKEAL
ncbi:NAD(P)-binding protein [Dentipellis sp. KUC8613]|nr:NAD(P)-binding protein [Dentipellis sp. KUC8613]